MKNDVGMRWSKVRLNDICNVITCGVAKRPEYQESGVPFLSSLNVKENRFILKAYKYISEKDHEQLTKYSKPEKGDILYTRVGSFGEAAVIDLDFDFSIFVSLTLIKPKHELVDSRFLMWHLNSPEVRSYANNNTSGIGVQNLNVGVVREFQIPLPPLPIQKRIAEILDAADALKRKDQALLKKYDELAQAIFIDMFGDPVKNEKGWEVKKLGAVTNMKAGNFISASEICTDLDDSLYPCYGGNGLRGFVKSFTHNGNYILIGRQGALCGNVKITTGKFHATEHAVVCSPKIEYNVLWFYYLLGALNLNKYASGAAQPGLNVSTLVDIDLIFAPLKFQNQFAEKLELIEKQNTNLKVNLIYTNQLFKSLIQKAFKGELVK